MENILPQEPGGGVLAEDMAMELFIGLKYRSFGKTNALISADAVGNRL